MTKRTVKKKKTTRRRRRVDVTRHNDPSLGLTTLAQLNIIDGRLEAIETLVAGIRLAESQGSQEYRWTTSEGDEVLPRDMDLSHLINTIYFCHRRILDKSLRTTWIDEYQSYVDGLYHCLLEAKRRGIRA